MVTRSSSAARASVRDARAGSQAGSASRRPASSGWVNSSNTLAEPADVGGSSPSINSARLGNPATKTNPHSRVSMLDNIAPQFAPYP